MIWYRVNVDWAVNWQSSGGSVAVLVVEVERMTGGEVNLGTIMMIILGRNITGNEGVAVRWMKADTGK